MIITREQKSNYSGRNNEGMENAKHRGKWRLLLKSLMMNEERSKNEE